MGDRSDTWGWVGRECCRTQRARARMGRELRCGGVASGVGPVCVDRALLSVRRAKVERGTPGLGSQPAERANPQRRRGGGSAECSRERSRANMSKPPARRHHETRREKREPTFTTFTIRLRVSACAVCTGSQSRLKTTCATAHAAQTRASNQTALTQQNKRDERRSALGALRSRGPMAVPRVRTVPVRCPQHTHDLLPSQTKATKQSSRIDHSTRTP